MTYQQVLDDQDITLLWCEQHNALYDRVVWTQSVPETWSHDQPTSLLFQLILGSCDDIDNYSYRKHNHTVRQPQKAKVDGTEA